MRIVLSFLFLLFTICMVVTHLALEQKSDFPCLAKLLVNFGGYFRNSDMACHLAVIFSITRIEIAHVFKKFSCENCVFQIVRLSNRFHGSRTCLCTAFELVFLLAQQDAAFVPVFSYI